jgi:16S rRNA A1518/A1519 N6-dimethyltransferase RsmA/KsgA/DIM1 with predicted DNA glycosylase/AP lyase activity
VLGLAVESGEITDKKVLLQQFYSPEWLASSFVMEAKLQPTDIVFEPSAGEGALARAASAYVPLHQIHCVEIDEDNVTTLRQQGFRCVHADFLKVPPTQIYDVVLMNPPCAA